MELRPKARKKDVEMYIESCRTKFGCFETGGPGEDLAGECTIIMHVRTIMYLSLYTVLNRFSRANQREYPSSP